LKIEVPPAAMAALPTGIHWITGRVQNENGDWSTAFTRPFLKYNPASAPVPLASRIEYHWRLNGAPVGTPVVLAAEVPAKVITFHFLASLRGLLDGATYQLVATPFDHFGNQGFSETRQVKIETSDEDGDGLPDLWQLTHGITSGSHDSDGDGLTNLQEFLLRTNPRLKDSSGDGLSDGFALALGLDPLKSYPSMRNAMIAHSQDLGLAREDQIRALNPQTPLISRDPQSGRFTVRLGLIEASGLDGPWNPLPIIAESSIVNDGWLEYSFTSNSDTMFYRLGLDE
jgi:hypothetical protein